MQQIKVFEAYAGIGSCTGALLAEGINHEVIGISEWNITSSIAFDAIHSTTKKIEVPGKHDLIAYLDKFTWSSNGKDPIETVKRVPHKKLIQLYEAQKRTNNYGSIIDMVKRLEDDPNCVNDFDLFTHGSPCQDFSVAGKGAGGEEGSGTRSSLMWYSVEVIRIKRPKYILWENVKNVLSKKHIHNYAKYVDSLKELGYNSYSNVLNAKDYSIPQNRQRIFVFSVLDEIDPFKESGFDWPKPFDNGIRLKHLLETDVADKFYISKEKCEKLLENLNGRIDLSKAIIGTCHPNNNLGFSTREIVYNAEKTSPCLTATMYKDPPRVLVVGNVNPSGRGMGGNVYVGNMSPTLTTGEGSKMVIPCITPDRVDKRQNGRRFKENDDPMFTITGQDKHGVLLGECDEGIVVRVANRIGYQIAKPGDSINMEQPNSNTRRGRVGSQIAQTLNCGSNQAVVEPVIIDNIYKGRPPRVYKICPTIMSGRSGLIVTEPQIIDDQGRITKRLKVTSYCPTLRAQDHGNPPKVILSPGAEGDDYPTRYGEQSTNECNCLGHVEGINGYDILKRVYDIDGCAPTISTCGGGNTEPKIYTRFRIRKLTPRECGRLMDFYDWEIDRIIQAGISDSAMYQLFGNSIVKMCPRLIFRAAFKTE